MILENLWYGCDAWVAVSGSGLISLLRDDNCLFVVPIDLKKKIIFSKIHPEIVRWNKVGKKEMHILK